MTHENSSQPNAVAAAGDRLLPRRELRAIVPVSDMTIWRWERDNRFPRHLSIHGRNYWLLSEVQDWLERQARGEVPVRKEIAR